MAVAVEFAAPSEFVVHASGRVTFDEVMRAEADLLAHPALDARARLLVDGREVEAAPTAAELRSIAREMKAVHARGVKHFAIVAGSDFVYGVARMFAVFAQAVSLHVAVFRDIESARRWLRAHGTQAEPLAPS